MTIAANISARNAYTARLAGSPRAFQTVGDTQLPIMTGNEATEALFGWVYKQPGMATIEDCRKALMLIDGKWGQDESLAALQRFGAQRLIDLWMGSFEGFCAFCATCLEGDRKPSESHPA